MTTDAGSGLELRDGYEKYHPWPIKFPNGKTYKCPILPLDVNEDDEREKELLDALEAWEEALHDDSTALTKAAKMKSRIARAALGCVYEDVGDGLALDAPTFLKVYQRLCGGEPGK